MAYNTRWGSSPCQLVETCQTPVSGECVCRRQGTNHISTCQLVEAFSSLDKDYLITSPFHKKIGGFVRKSF